MEPFRIERQTDIPLEFTGDKLVDLHSRDDERQERWQEIRIYRTNTGKYVTELVGQSTVRGERAFRTVKVVDNPAAVRQALKREKAGREFLNDLALEALEEAGKQDKALAAANVAERI